MKMSKQRRVSARACWLVPSVRVFFGGVSQLVCHNSSHNAGIPETTPHANQGSLAGSLKLTVNSLNVEEQRISRSLWKVWVQSLMMVLYFVRMTCNEVGTAEELSLAGQ
jgi:hypothetical protein